MSTQGTSNESIPEHARVSDDAPRGFPFGRAILLLCLLGLVVWTVVRVRVAQGEQARLLAERNESAEAAKKERKETPLVLRSGAPATWTPLVRIEGTLAAAEEADLAFKVAGRVHAIRVKVGDFVHKGQTLATLEQNESLATLEQARAAVRAAEAQLNLASDSEQRTAALTSSGAGSQQAALQTKEQRALAQAQVEGARAALALAQANLDNSQLVASFSGYVTRVPSGTGQVVNPMSPGSVLFHMQNTTELRLIGTVNEAEASLVHVGEAIRVVGPDGALVGKVSAVLGSVDAATRRVPLEARIPNDPKHPLLAGSYVRAEIEGKQAVPVLRFPAGVIRPGSQNEVMVVEGGRMVARHVVYHPASEGDIYVRAGLDPHEFVVVDPSAEAKDGDPIPAGSQAAPAAHEAR